jgi:hypothetical protein
MLLIKYEYHIEKIISLAKEHSLSDAFFETANDHLDCISNLIHTSPVQTALFALLFEHFGVYSVSIDDLASTLKLEKIQLIKYLDDFEELKHRKLIREKINSRDYKSATTIDYIIPLSVINIVRKGIEELLSMCQCESAEKIASKIGFAP